MASKTRLENALSFTFWERIFARVCSDKSSFFIPSFRHQDSNSYYFVVATAKIPKLWKCTSLDVSFLTSRSKDRVISCQWIIQPKPIDCLYDTFLKFRNAPQTPIQLKGLMTTGWKVSKYGWEETPYLDTFHRVDYLRHVFPNLNILREKSQSNTDLCINPVLVATEKYKHYQSVISINEKKREKVILNLVFILSL